MIEGVFCPSIGQLTVFVFNQHVGFADGERAFGIDGSNDLNVHDVKFMATFGSLVSTNMPREYDTRFDDGSFERFKHLIAEIFLFANTLNGSCGIPKNNEPDVVVSTAPFHPAFQFNRLVCVLSVLHIADPCGLDHALTKNLHRFSLCECLPHGISKHGAHSIISCKGSKRFKLTKACEKDSGLRFGR